MCPGDLTPSDLLPEYSNRTNSYFSRPFSRSPLASSVLEIDGAFAVNSLVIEKYSIFSTGLFLLGCFREF